MRAIILCGGIGKRMQPITTDKCMIKFNGRELLLHQLDAVMKHSKEKPVLICSPNNVDEIRALIGDKAEYTVQAEPKGMADAVMTAKKFMRGAVLIFGSNDVFDENAYSIIQKTDGDAAILAYKVTKYFPGGYLTVKGDRITGVVEKPGEGKEPSDLVKIVFDYYKKGEDFIQYIEKAKSDKDDIYEVALAAFCKDKKVVAVPYTGYWGAMKYPFHILGLTKHFLTEMKPSIAKTAKIAPGAVIKGNTVIDDGARVFEGAVVSDSYIGKNAIVGNGSLVRESHIGEKSVVGFSTEVARSYIASNVWFHNNYVGDSIVMDNVMFGSGCVTANFRFDEKEVYMEIDNKRIGTGSDKFGCVIGRGAKTGVNSCIYPGIKIGEATFIGPGVVLRESVGPNEVILLAQQWQRREQRDVLEPDKKAELMKKLKH